MLTHNVFAVANLFVYYCVLICDLLIYSKSVLGDFYLNPLKLTEVDLMCKSIV